MAVTLSLWAFSRAPASDSSPFLPMFQALQTHRRFVRLQGLSKQDPDCCLDAVKCPDISGQCKNELNEFPSLQAFLRLGFLCSTNDGAS